MCWKYYENLTCEICNCQSPRVMFRIGVILTTLSKHEHAHCCINMYSHWLQPGDLREVRHHYTISHLLLQYSPLKIPTRHASYNAVVTLQIWALSNQSGASFSLKSWGACSATVVTARWLRDCPISHSQNLLGNVASTLGRTSILYYPGLDHPEWSHFSLRQVSI